MSNKVSKKSEMYQRGYENAAINFAYIPDFKSSQEKIDFENGLKDGYDKVKLLKSNINEFLNI